MIASDLLVGLGYIVATLASCRATASTRRARSRPGAVVSAVLAISLQSTLGNILGGVALQLDGSIHEGDWIQLENGKQGKVRAIRWRHTVVETRDWSTIIVPERAAAREQHHDPRQARRRAVAAAHVGLVQRRLPLPADAA